MFKNKDVVTYEDYAGLMVVAEVDYSYTDEGWELVKMTNGDVVPADCVSLLNKE